MSAAESGTLLQVSSVARSFGKTAALSDVSLQIARAEVHALVGENGAGKSTLMKILAGAEIPDRGSMTFDGKLFAPRSPRDSLAAGIAMIYQEFNLAPHLSIQANLLLGREQPMGGMLLRGSILPGGAAQRRACRAALDRLGMYLSLDTRVGELGVADQQMIEIARALLSGARLVIMDEPTSALASHEVQRLFAIIRQLRAGGISVIYISHFLEEIEQLADRLTVIRDGRSIATGQRTDWPRQRIIETMVGRKVTEMYPRIEHSIGEPLLEVRELAGRKLPKLANFTLHRGEVLGIAGLVGAGRTEALRSLFGLDPRDRGTATLSGVRIEHFSPAGWTNRHVGMLSEDRKTEGLAQNLSCAANIVLPALRRNSRLGFIGWEHGLRASRGVGKTLRIKWASPAQRVSGLSGGNQQKVAMGRLLYTEADVLLLDEPTRGIDVGAKVDLYRAIGELARRGKGIVVVSSYLPELFGICDRIAVMSRGVLSPAMNVAELTPEKVMSLAVGSDKEPAANLQ